MKVKDIKAILKANKNISDYEISIVDKDSRELFYVLDHLEINRAVKVNNTKIEIYVSNNKTIGSSTVTLTAADDEKSLNKKINDAVKKAKAVKNDYYPLADKTENIVEVSKTSRDLNDIASKVAKAVFKADVYKNGWINSTEIFVSEFKEEFINSKGIDHKSNSFKIELECIPTWSNKKEEFELYKYYKSNKIDYEQVTDEVDEILKLAKDRANALTLKDIELPSDIKVLVKNDMLETIVSNLTNDLSYRSTFMKYNHYNINDTISNNEFNLTIKGTISGCADSKKYDNHGVVLKSKKIISNGKAKANHGDIRFGYYLNVDKVTGTYPVCQIDAKPCDYKKQKHLIIETFSSPQLEESSGYWGGEVRLARYFDGKKYIPLTGFSIAGNIYEDMKNVEFSKEETTSPIYKGPKYFIFNNLKIS